MDKTLVEIIGIFNSEHSIGARLELSGPFSRAAIDEVIFKFRPCPYTAAWEYQKGKGQATFFVRDKKEAEEFSNLLNKDLEKYGFVIKYKR